MKHLDEVDKVDDLYKKSGKRYYRIGTQWWGFPSNGIWLVLDGSESQIIKMGDIPKDPWPYIRLAKYQNKIANIIVTADYASPMDIAKKIIKVLAGHSKEENNA